jgi:hypothetical protein
MHRKIKADMLIRTQIFPSVIRMLSIVFLVHLVFKDKFYNQCLNIFFRFCLLVFFIYLVFPTEELHQISSESFLFCEFFLHVGQALIRVYADRLRINGEPCKLRVDKIFGKLVHLNFSFFFFFFEQDSVIFDSPLL